MTEHDGAMDCAPVVVNGTDPLHVARRARRVYLPWHTTDTPKTPPVYRYVRKTARLEIHAAEMRARSFHQNGIRQREASLKGRRTRQAGPVEITVRYRMSVSGKRRRCPFDEDSLRQREAHLKQWRTRRLEERTTE